MTSSELRRLQDEEVPIRNAGNSASRVPAPASTYFIFALLGAPTALMMRRGTQLGAMSVAVGYALLYYLLSMRLGRILFLSGFIPPNVAAWAVIVIGAVAGAYLTWRALRE
jgi:lipopolysaccharide export LptBFGC system permease protein LptF